jgi:hypothetical protein
MIVARHEVPGVMRKRALSQRDGGPLHRYPGTSCLATISLSLRDKSHSPIEGSRTKLALMLPGSPLLAKFPLARLTSGC